MTIYDSFFHKRSCFRGLFVFVNHEVVDLLLTLYWFLEMNFVWYPNEVSSHFLNPHTLKSLFHSLTFSVDTLSGVRWGNQPFSRLRETSCTSSPIAPTEDLPGGFGLTEKVAHATALDFLACHRGDDRASGNNTSFYATRARKTCNTRVSSCFLFRERKKTLCVLRGFVIVIDWNS